MAICVLGKAVRDIRRLAARSLRRLCHERERSRRYAPCWQVRSRSQIMSYILNILYRAYFRSCMTRFGSLA
jgi:hypothetical protein